VFRTLKLDSLYGYSHDQLQVGPRSGQSRVLARVFTLNGLATLERSSIRSKCVQKIYPRRFGVNGISFGSDIIAKNARVHKSAP
jgi:hypothetical protein